MKTNEYMRKLNPNMDAETFKESAAAQKGLIATEETKRLGLGAMTLERWRTLVSQLLDLKVIDKPVDAQALFFELSKTE
jgi:NitT/TauT family transport system substrate-binding protein